MLSTKNTKQHALLIAFAAGSVSASVHANTLSDAFTNGTFSAEIRNTLELATKTDAASEASPQSHSKSLGSALTLDYVTGNYHGLKLGIGAQSSYDWGLQNDDTWTTAGGENDIRVTTQNTSLYRAYLDYTFNKSITQTRIRLGRQRMVSPLVMNGSNYPMQDSFDGVMIENKDLSKTTVRFMYITKWNMRYGNEGTNGSLTKTDKSFHSPILSLYVKNQSMKDLTIEAQILSKRDNTKLGDVPTAITLKRYDESYLGLTYRIPNSTWLLGAKGINANFADGGNTNLWGVKAKKTIHGVGIQATYEAVADSANLPGTLGHVTMIHSYAPTISGNNIYAGQKTSSIAVDYGFGVPRLDVTAGSGSAMKPYFTTSPKPARISLRGSETSVSRSQTTAAGA